jgi:hypothetical protein
MPDFNVRSDSVNVEQIMEQIRARIREKRGVDYTEQQIRELAAVKLEKFLDPRGVRSDLLEQFRRARQAAAELPSYEFEDTTLYESHRLPFLRRIRRLLNPILRLFFNPNPLIRALHIQAQLNAYQADRRRVIDELYYELIHNLVVEMTKLGIETKNMKMRLESIASRLDFNERRARALESVVVYQPASERESIYDAPSQTPAAHQPAAHQPAAPAGSQPQQSRPPGAPEGPGQRSRRRRRRRGRRGGGAAAAIMAGSQNAASPVAETKDAHAAAQPSTVFEPQSIDSTGGGSTAAPSSRAAAPEPPSESDRGFDSDEQ